MTDRVFKDYVCWKQQKFSSLFKVDALSVERPVFLATHVPFSTITYVKPERIPDTTEERLLQELQNKALNDENTFLVVQGMAGSGKSHLIRWLSERYEATSSMKDKEVVMLIERANSSLHQTLIQIIEHKSFDSSLFSDQINRIKNATNKLSEDSLAETLLHFFRIGTKEKTEIEVFMEKAKWYKKRVNPYISDFLHNAKVREHLKRKDGPIERLTKHLSSGIPIAELDSANNPIFEAKDFEFTPILLREIRDGGYESTRILAELLDRKEEGRQYTAKYLNALISFAIQQTTQISVDDLKALFFDLRKELKKQGKTLILMVEDISVFTGLDAGLIDVMVTHQTGTEMQKSFCRMTSVVGITDGYFKDHFPPNIKRRIDYHITLNDDSSGRGNTTHLFNDIDEMAKFVSRYLNVLRMPKSDFEGWSAKGCKPSDLPNACIECDFREKCHIAFGAVALDNTNDERDVGLYPLNKNLLSVIASNLDTKKKKTPHTLLLLLEDLLEHSPAVENSSFPVINFLPNVAPPRFDHYTFLKNVAKKDAGRLERFMMYWGNQTVVEATKNGITYIGGIPLEAFIAFGLPVISGREKSTILVPPSVVFPKPVSPEPTPVEKEDIQDKVFHNINSWRRGDEALKEYQPIKTAWLRYLKTRIDWDFYHITHTQLGKFKAPQLVIEGQSTRAPSIYLFFERSDKLAEFFEALTQVGKYSSKLPSAKLGRYLQILERWLEEHEDIIVQYVKTPYKRDEIPPKLGEHLDQVLFENNLFLAMLGGDLQPSRHTGKQLVISLVRETDGNQFNNIWNQPFRVLKNERGRSEKWLDAIKWGSHPRRVLDIRDQFLQMLNRPQRNSRRKARFIDAPYLLELIANLNKRKWKVDKELDIEIEKPEIVYQYWLKMYQYLQLYADTILASEEAYINRTLSTLDAWIGNHQPKDVFEAMDSTLIALSASNKLYGFRQSEDLTIRKLEFRIEKLKEAQAKETSKDKMLSYSSICDYVRDSWEYIDYFQKYGDFVKIQLAKLEEALSEADGSRQTIDPGRQVDEDYEKLLTVLKSIKTEVESEEIVVS